ncbi:MAG: hypothetical protein H8E44_42820 [Planctomycetes bacterium]|nr:hypothetical protein [Planctomycetota bacterium]MBL7037661.1 hypothetical protein [Pirellulaceae bacterium]
MLGIDTINQLTDTIVAQIGGDHPNLLNRYPLRRYIECLDRYPELAPYDYRSAEVAHYCDAIVRETCTGTLESYHKLLLLSLIARAQDELAGSRLPANVRSMYDDNFRRIARSIERGNVPPGFFRHPKFCKELAICTRRFIPAGVQKVHLHGLPKKCLLRKRPRELRSAVRLFAELGGLKPLYEMHLHVRDRKAMALFNPEGWTQFYRTVADLLEMHPRVKGAFGSGWLFDPQLEHISSELAYLRHLVADNGGTVFGLGLCDARATKDATRMSPVRKRLYVDGKYTPRDYLVVWPRKPLIAWAHTQRQLQTENGEDRRLCCRN